MDHDTRTLNNLKTLNRNANGITAQRPILITFLARYNIDVACISEIYLASQEKYLPFMCTERAANQEWHQVLPS